MSRGEQKERERTVVGGTDAARCDYEVVAIDHSATCLDTGRVGTESGGECMTYISCSSSAMTSTRLLF